VSFGNADAEGMPLGMAALDDGLGAAFTRCVFDRTQTSVRRPVYLPIARVAVPDGRIIYAVFGVLVCLLLWRVATQWKVSAEEI
jgi:hypothetical protein